MYGCLHVPALSGCYNNEFCGTAGILSGIACAVIDAAVNVASRYCCI
jgi:hypothetical protein